MEDQVKAGSVVQSLLNTEDLKAEIATLSKDNRVMQTKLTILYHFIGLLRKGYDALLHHGVNYQSLPEHERDFPLDTLEGQPLNEARDKALGWIERMLSGINAAVRRKQFKVHDNSPPTGSRLH